MRRTLPWLLLVLLLLWGYERALPSFVERMINRVDDHPEWVVGNKAQILHDSIPVSDLHADPLLWKRDWLVDEGRGHTDLPRMQAGGVALQVLTAVTKSPSGQNYEKNSADTDTLLYLTIAQRWPIETWSSPMARALYQADRLADWDARAGDAFRVIRNQGELEALLAERAEGKRGVGGIFGIEGAHALEGSLDNLEILHERGLRVVGLTHFFDNRIGGFMVAEVARLFHESGKRPDFGLYVVNSVQEEVGLKGAGMIAERIKPDVAICTDVTHDTTTPMIEQKKTGTAKIGAGPVITYAPAVQNRVREHLIATAEKHEIPFQRLVSAPATGTDTDAFAYSNQGVPSALVALALRYMHTTVEMVHREDVENVIRLIHQSVTSIEAGETFSYFD